MDPKQQHDRDPLVIAPWLLPVLVGAILLPVVAAFALGGPGVGLAVGFAVTAIGVLIVARLRPRERIEVAAGDDSTRRILVVALAPVDGPHAAGEVARAARNGGGAAGERDAEALVVAPASNRPLAHWTSYVRGAREAAERRLVLSLGSLAAAQLDARGQVGDSDPVQAVEDALRVFPADEAVLVCPPLDARGDGTRTFRELRERLPLPVKLVEVDPEDAGGKTPPQ